MKQFVLSAKLFNLLDLSLTFWNLRNWLTELTQLAQFVSDFVTLFILPNLSTAMSSLMLPDVNRSHLGATPEITETTGVTFEGLWR